MLEICIMIGGMWQVVGIVHLRLIKAKLKLSRSGRENQG